jgi:hypothetical protein
MILLYLKCFHEFKNIYLCSNVIFKLFLSFENFQTKYFNCLQNLFKSIFLSKFIQIVCSKFLKFIFKRIKNIHNLNKKIKTAPIPFFLSARSTSNPTFLLACGPPHHQGRPNQPPPLPRPWPSTPTQAMALGQLTPCTRPLRVPSSIHENMQLRKMFSPRESVYH